MRLIVSFTTTPTRIKSIEPMINSILQQSRQPDMFIINLPTKYLKDKNELIIPDFIKNNDKIIVNRCEDVGPATKLLGILYSSIKFNNDDHIITVDDDISYQKDLVKYYHNYCLLNSKFVFGLQGFNLVNGNIYYTNKAIKLTQVDVLEGYGSICYPYKFLKKDILNTIKYYPSYLLNSDDIILSNYFNKKTNLYLIFIPKFNINKNISCGYGFQNDALSFNNGNFRNHLFNYRKAYYYLLRNNQCYFGKNKLKKKLISSILYTRRNNHKWRKGYR